MIHVKGRTYPGRRALNFLHVNDLVLLYELHLRHFLDLLDDPFRKAARVTGDMAIIDVADSSQVIPYERVVGKS